MTTRNTGSSRNTPQRPPGPWLFSLPPLARIIEELRTQCRLHDVSRRELARLAGLSLSTISKVEAGVMDPSYETVRQIQFALDKLENETTPRAGDVMTKDVIGIAPDAPVAKARGLMAAHNVSQLPVLEHDACVGSISESILLDQVASGADLPGLDQQKVGSVMGPPFPTVPTDAPRRTLYAMLRYHPLIVVAENGQIQGVIANMDLW